ncbi:MarR family transcriptional regulator [Acinetobacter sp. XH1639]|uniref:MarR family winged helix-turn-helix transcriptional regulator n=1 Tax=Acinetobacter sp. XH1639 TaxID=3157368 RepID=UPI0032B6052F
MSKNKILDDQLCFSLYSVANALTRQYRPVLKDFGLTYPQFIVLLALYDKDNISMKELSERTLIDSGTLTPLVQKLEANDFLNRMSVIGDERMKKVVLSGKALELKEKIINIPNLIRCSMRMTDQELNQLKQLSQRLLEDL